jgi:hypothetical protein
MNCQSLPKSVVGSLQWFWREVHMDALEFADLYQSFPHTWGMWIMELRPYFGAKVVVKRRTSIAAVVASQESCKSSKVLDPCNRFRHKVHTSRSGGVWRQNAKGWVGAVLREDESQEVGSSGVGNVVMTSVRLSSSRSVPAVSALHPWR